MFSLKKLVLLLPLNKQIGKRNADYQVIRDMKITHVLTRFDPDSNPGGVERVVDELTQRQKDKHEIEIICRNQFGDDSREERDGVTIKRAECRDVSGLRTITAIPTMRELIQNSEAEIYHIHDWSPFINYTIAGSPKRSILTLHNREEKGAGHFLQDFCINRADIVTGVSKEVTSSLEDAFTVSNGTDTDKFRPLPREENYYVFVGNLVPGKGIEELAKVWNQDMPNLKIIGDGDLANKLQDEKSSNTELMGKLNHDKVAEIMAKSKGLIHPTRDEGFGLVIAESLASGRPVLTTETGIGNELISDHGIIISPEYDQAELRKAIEEFITREYNEEELRKYAENNFSWRQICEDYDELYEKV